MKKKTRASRIFQAALFAVSLGLLAYFCISDNNLALLCASLRSLNLFWLACAGGCVVLNWLLDALIIRELVCHAYASRYQFRHAFKTTMVGQYFNSVTPYQLGGQPMQLVSLIHQGVSSGIALSALIRKFLVYQTTITVFSLFVILIRYRFFLDKIQGFMALAVIGFFYQAGIVIVLLIFSYSPKITTRLIRGIVWVLTKIRIVKNPRATGEKVKNQLEFYIQNNKAMAGNRRLNFRVYGYTFAQMTALFAVPFFIYKAFRCPGFPVIDMLSAQSFVTMISSYTPLPGASGAAEGSFLILFQIFFNEKIIRQAMLLWRLLAYYSCIIVGAFFAGFDSRDKLESRLKPGEKQAGPTENGGPINE